MIPIVTLLGRRITGTDAHGSVWTLRGEEGFWGSPEIRRTRHQRSQQDGAHPSTSVLAERGVVLEGTIRAVSNAGLLASRDDLVGLVAVREGWIRWTDATGTTTQQVELDAGIRWRTHGDHVAEWQITYTAPDPARYTDDVELTAVLQTVARDGEGWQWPRQWPTDWHLPAASSGQSSAVAVYNHGNTPWWPRLRIETTAANPRVTCPETGDWIQINATIPAGQWIDIDARERTVRLNGVASWKWCTTWHGTWLAVPPGVSTSLVFAAAGTDPDGRLTIIAKEGAWL